MTLPPFLPLVPQAAASMRRKSPEVLVKALFSRSMVAVVLVTKKVSPLLVVMTESLAVKLAVPSSASPLMDW